MTDAKSTVPMGFVPACKEFFGFAPGQSLMQFRDDVNCLTDADREELAPLLSKEIGRPVTTTRAAKAI